MTTEQSSALLSEYTAYLAGKSPRTVEAYLRVLRQFLAWLTERPGASPDFQPEQLTRTALEIYLTELDDKGYSSSHRLRIKSAVGNFARWLIEEKRLLSRNPAYGVHVPPQPVRAPRELSPEQRFILRELVEKAEDIRGEALFALGYWAGCRVSDVSWLRLDNAHIGPKVGWLRVGYKGGKLRVIDLINAARRPLYAYRQHGGRNLDSDFFFTSQRSDRLTEAGIHHWWRKLKQQASYEHWQLIQEVTFHDLRHDFAHRARAKGWRLEELAYYLGHVTQQGGPAIQTTARYTQVSRKDIKTKLRLLGGE
jgi:site-specific recombinase XerD